MSSLELLKCLELLRYVREGDYVLSSDVNTPIKCIKIVRDWLLSICNTYNLDPKYVYELDPYINRLQYVRSGDIIEPEHHNTIVDTLKKLREVIEKIEALVYQEGYSTGYKEGYSEGYSTGYSTAIEKYKRLLINEYPVVDVLIESKESLAVNEYPSVDVLIEMKPPKHLMINEYPSVDVLIESKETLLINEYPVVDVLIESKESLAVNEYPSVDVQTSYAFYKPELTIQ